jgi:hypothetical protein
LPQVSWGWISNEAGRSLVPAGAVNVAQILASFLSQCKQPPDDFRTFIRKIPGLA